MKIATELKKSCMAFELKNGEILLISKEDVTEIAKKLIVEMMINKQNHVHIHKDNTIDKFNLLYKILTEQQHMKKSLKEQYCKEILNTICEGDEETITLEEHSKQKS